MNPLSLDRRRLLEGLGALALAGYNARDLSALTLPTSPTADTGATLCVVTPTATEGPYFDDEALHRSDLTSGTRASAVLEGMPLALNVRVHRVTDGGCSPLTGVRVDLWHADADGLYSDIPSLGTRGENYLRGYQLTDSTGAAHFTTIYPGWYPGRTPHIHFKVRGEHIEFTSQWYFEEAISDQVFGSAPYNRRGARARRNDRDFLFERRMVLDLQRNELGPGYLAAASIGIRA